MHPTEKFSDEKTKMQRPQQTRSMIPTEFWNGETVLLQTHCPQNLEYKFIISINYRNFSEARFLPSVYHMRATCHQTNYSLWSHITQFYFTQNLFFFCISHKYLCIFHRSWISHLNEMKRKLNKFHIPNV